MKKSTQRIPGYPVTIPISPDGLAVVSVNEHDTVIQIRSPKDYERYFLSQDSASKQVAAWEAKLDDRKLRHRRFRIMLITLACVTAASGLAINIWNPGFLSIILMGLSLVIWYCLIKAKWFSRSTLYLWELTNEGLVDLVSVLPTDDYEHYSPQRTAPFVVSAPRLVFDWCLIEHRDAIFELRQDGGPYPIHFYRLLIAGYRTQGTKAFEEARRLAEHRESEAKDAAELRYLELFSELNPESRESFQPGVEK